MIPLLPTLRPARFIAPKATPGELPFPLASPRTRWYYFARNGVWESVDVLGLSAGDEVLIPGYTSGLEVEAFEARGIIPVFYNLTASLTPDWQDIKNKLSRQTKVFYLIHYFGFPQPLPQAVEFCTQYRLLLFEDNALGFLSKDTTGKPLGSTGEVGLFCPRKTLPLPHGGMLVVNRPDLPLPPTPQQQPSRYSTLGETSSLMIRDIMKREGFAASAARIFKKNALPRLKRSLRTFGLAHTESGGAKFEPDKALWGMSGLSRHLLPRFDYNQIIARRRKNFCLLASCLRNLNHNRLRILYPDLPDGVCPLEFMIMVENLDYTVKTLADNDIECGLHWWWERPQDIGKQFPNIRPLLTQGILLPIHQDLHQEDIQKIAQAVREAVQ